MPIWNISQTFAIFYNHLLHFVFIWYIFPGLASCNKKNLATLVQSPRRFSFDQREKFFYRLELEKGVLESLAIHRNGNEMRKRITTPEKN
jgi:hypothetical protein